MEMLWWLHRGQKPSASWYTPELRSAWNEFWDRLLRGVTERLNLRNPDPHIQKMKSCLITDSKNVYDGLNRIESAGLHLEELRTGVELLSVKERIGPAGVAVRWVDSGQELADGLTKCWKHEQLIRVLSLGYWKLVYDL